MYCLSLLHLYITKFGSVQFSQTYVIVILFLPSLTDRFYFFHRFCIYTSRRWSSGRWRRRRGRGGGWRYTRCRGPLRWHYWPSRSQQSDLKAAKVWKWNLEIFDFINIYSFNSSHFTQRSWSENLFLKSWKWEVLRGFLCPNIVDGWIHCLY